MAPRPERLVAHTPPAGSDDWHYLDDHSLEVAELAAEFAEPFGGQGVARWLGLLHDAGKAHPDFQDYLWKNFLEPKKKHQTCDHKSAGALEGYENYGGLPFAQILLGHHGGLSNAGSVINAMDARRQRDNDRMQLAWDLFSSHPAIRGALEQFDGLTAPEWFSGNELEMEFLARMLFSCLVDADYLNTEEHRNPDARAARQKDYPPIGELWSRFERDQQRFVVDPAAATTTVNRVRAEVYAACVEKASRPPGFFRLTVPTGGGKTRSGLAFALRHAVDHDLSRIIVAVPYLTITDQTAKEYRETLKDDFAILEHHSGIEPVSKDSEGSDDPQETWRKLACQNWEPPLIVTTTVQLFESLFANRTSACRKLHNIARSVIILDEIQTLPAHMRRPLFDVLQELVLHYGVTVVLSTATQPVLDTIEQELDTAGRKVVEIAPDRARLFRSLVRVRYKWPEPAEVWDWERVAAEMRDYEQVLTIVNTIDNATTLFNALDDQSAIYLSTRLCQAHRRDQLTKIRERLDKNEPCRVVSTQLVEAGVDIDFPVVMRALAPFDRIVQAAGRCNREGKRDIGRVVVFDPGEFGGMPPGTYNIGKQITDTLLQAATLDPHNPDAFREYFASLYAVVDDDRRGIQAMRKLSNFEDVSAAFKLIDKDSFPVYVPYIRQEGPSQAIQEAEHDERIASLRRSVYGKGGPIRDLLQETQPFIVNCNYREQPRLEENCSIAEIVPGLWEWRDPYDRQTGLNDSRLEPRSLLA